MDLLEIMKNRRSIRKYNDKDISEENLEKILQAALLSPTAKGIKSWDFIVIKDKKTLELLSECKVGAKFVKDANVAIAVLGDMNKTNTWIEDCSIAMSNMHLMASFLNVGSCWIQIRERTNENGIDSEIYAKKILKFPDNYRLLALLVLGETEEKLKPNEITETLKSKVHKEIF